MSRGLLGAAAGAGGASVYFSGLGDSLRFVLDHGMGFSHGSGGANMADKHYDELYRMVQQLSTEMGRKQQGITIVHGNDSKSGALYYVVAVAAGGAIYLRVFRGWKLVDMMYVTRSSLKKSVGQLSDGLDGLGQRLSSVKTYLQGQIKALSGKQDQAMAVQAAMQEHLGVVGADVENTRAEVSEMHGTVRELEANMEQLSLSQQYANRGIYILCKVVGDMMKAPAAGGPGGRAASAVELENYIRHPPTIGGRVVPGLEGLLQDGEGDSRPATPFGRGSLESGRLARAATESAIHTGARRLPPQGLPGGGLSADRSYSVAAADRGYANAAADRSYANAPPDRSYSSAMPERGHGNYGPAASGGHGDGHESVGKWQQQQPQQQQQQQHDKLSPRSTLSAGYEPDTPGRDGREEPRLARYGGGGGGGSSLRRGQYGKLAPWDRQASSGASSLDGSLLDARA
jgi:hypothetical protein